MGEVIKKYFVKDEELTSREQDRLSSRDVAKNINMIIDNTESSTTIAVTGKSGSGKSSIVNIVTGKYENDLENYNVSKINVWTGDTNLLREKLMITSEIIQEKNNEAFGDTEKQQEKIDEAFGDTEKQIEADRIADKADSRKSAIKAVLKFGKVILVFLACFVITSIIFWLMEYWQGKDIYRGNDIFFVENAYLNYRDNLAFIFIFAAGLTAITYIIDTLLKTKHKMKENKINVQPGQLKNEEMSIEDIEDSSVEENIKPVIDETKKNIIVIEDIDKLSVEKMLETFEEIKYCQCYTNCICIVPFDERIVKKAIETSNESKCNADYKTLDFNKLLEKIFQFKVYVPNISNGSIKDYSVELVKEQVPDFLREYCEISTFEKIIREVLIYKNVRTPRHAKKIINNFINNKIIISQRVRKGMVDKEYASSKKFDLELAKISVIQADFHELYDLLFIEPTYLEALTELYCMEIDDLRDIFESLNDELKQFFASKYRSLKAFLKQTRSIEIEDITTILYFTKIKTEVMFKDRSLLSYISGYEDITTLKIQEVLELLNLINSKDDLNEFTQNNIEKLISEYRIHSNDKAYFITFKEIIDRVKDYMEEKLYTQYLIIVADNYNYYQDIALDVFNNQENEIPVNVMNVLFERMQQTISANNYDKTFSFLKDNADYFFDEDERVTEYVQFLVNNINLSSNPTEVIEELDNNFTRIGKIYELNCKIRGLENLDYDNAYDFMAKSIDNSDLDKMINVMNAILSDNNSIESAMNIEERMSNYNFVDLIECNVDDINDGKFEGNETLLINLIDIASSKQDSINADDVMVLIQTALKNENDNKYILSVYEVLNKFDREYFYEKRRNFNEIIYASFHDTKSEKVKKAALDCTRYFKNTRLFVTKLTDKEHKFYKAN